MQNVSRIDQTPNEAMNRVNHSIKSLAKNYTSLLKLYVKDGSSLVAKEAAFGIAAGILAFMGWCLFIVASVALAFPAIPFWASIGFWALFHLGIAGYLFMRIKKDLKEEDMPKAKPVEPLKTAAQSNPQMYGGGFVP